jgi:hypothetical protein
MLRSFTPLNSNVKGEWRLLAYSAEKLDSAWNSVKFGEMETPNSLFLLGRVPAETLKFSGNGVFQQNRPTAAINGSEFHAQTMAAF